MFVIGRHSFIFKVLNYFQSTFLNSEEELMSQMLNMEGLSFSRQVP